MTVVPALLLNVSFGSLIAPSKSARDAIYFLTSGLSLSNVPLDVINAIKNCTDEEDLSEIASIYKNLSENIVYLLENEINAAKLSCDYFRNEAIDLGDEIAGALSNENERILRQFEEFVIRSVKSKITQGKFLFSSREYIDIDGSDGVKNIIRNLALTDEEKGDIGLNIDAVMADKIKNKFTDWVDKSYEVVEMYIEISDKLTGLLKETNANITKSANERQKILEVLNDKISKWEEITNTFGASVQKEFEAAADYIKDTNIEEQSKSDVMFGVL